MTTCPIHGCYYKIPPEAYACRCGARIERDTPDGLVTRAYAPWGPIVFMRRSNSAREFEERFVGNRAITSSKTAMMQSEVAA